MSLLRAVEIEEPSSTVPRKRGWLPFSGWHLLLMPVALLFALPLVQMVLTSFMTDAEINSFPPKFIPTSINLGGYQQFLTDSPAPRWMMNTVIVATISVIAHLILCSTAGYGYARLKFRGRNFGFFAIVATIMIPTQLLMIPTYVMFSKLGVVDTLAAAFIPQPADRHRRAVDDHVPEPDGEPGQAAAHGRLPDRTEAVRGNDDVQRP